MTAVDPPLERWARPDARATIGETASAVWAALSPVGRVALAGVLASAALAVALGIFIPTEIRRHLLIADGRGLEAAVAAIEPSLPDLSRRPLAPNDIEVLDRIVDRSILDSDHVRAKLWSLDGEVIYSDAHELIGRRFADVDDRLAEVVSSGVIVEVTDLTDPENILERRFDRLIEVYVPVRDGAGQIIGVFEIYENVAFVEDAIGRVTVATWLAIGSGLALLLVFLVVLVGASVRTINRDRAAAEARAEELAVVVDAAEAVASSLEPDELLARLQSRVREALGLSRVTRETGQRPVAAFTYRLRDGSWLAADRDGPAIGAEDERVLRSVAASLDAALANASLFVEVRDLARSRQELLRKVVDAHEDERRHLVGELHDSLASKLIRILYGIRGLGVREGLSAEAARAELASLEGLVIDTESELRGFMSRVRPIALEELGMVGAIREAVTRFGQETGIAASLVVRDRGGSRARETQLVVLRAVEEALLNVRKHAIATRVRVSLVADERGLRLSVDDDGVGWRRLAAREHGRGLGLEYLRDRVTAFGGTITLARSRLGGARLVIAIPDLDR